MVAFERGMVAFERGMVAFERGMVAFERGMVAFEIRPPFIVRRWSRSSAICPRISGGGCA